MRDMVYAEVEGAHELGGGLVSGGWVGGSMGSFKGAQESMGESEQSGESRRVAAPAGGGVSGGFDRLIEEAAVAGRFDWDEGSVDEDEREESLSVLCFELGQGSYAIASDYVREIVSDLPVTPVPGAPGHVRGVTVFRRQVLGVLSLAQWLDPAEGQKQPGSSRIIIVEVGPYTVGLEADALSGMQQWPVEVLERDEIPPTINSRIRRYALGLRLEREQVAILLDVPRLLRDAAVR